MIVALDRRAPGPAAPDSGGDGSSLVEADALRVRELRKDTGCELARQGVRVDVRATVELVVGELVANALQHTTQRVLLAVFVEATGVRVIVTGEAAVPAGLWLVRPASNSAEQGRGMHLVARLTSSRGVTTGGNGVWCLVPYTDAECLGDAA